VIKLAEGDPSFALRVIQLGNSARNAPLKPIMSLKDAIVRIGIEDVASLMTSVAVTKVFVPVSKSEKRLWQHSIEVATIARKFAKVNPGLHVSPDVAYLCGLFHDIGLFLMFKDSQKDFNHIDDFSWTTPLEHLDAENKVFKSNHAELGAHICKRWKIPAPIPTIVAFHHVYDLPPSIAKHENVLNAIRLIQLADLSSELSARSGKANNLKDLSKCLDNISQLRTWCVEKIKSKKLLRDFKTVLNDAHLESQYSYKKLGMS
jgi:putative nucleotidyltransferase with HDIG domain